MPALPGTRFFYRVDGGEDNATALAATDWTEDVDGTFTGTDGEDYMAVAIGTSSIARNVNDITPAISGLQDLNTTYASVIAINAAAAATGTNLVYSLTGPAWLSIDSSTGQITGTAPSSDVSTTATVTVRNAAGSASDGFAVEVVSPGAFVPPVPSYTGTVSVTEDATHRYYTLTSDGDLTFDKVGLVQVELIGGGGAGGRNGSTGSGSAGGGGGASVPVVATVSVDDVTTYPIVVGAKGVITPTFADLDNDGEDTTAFGLTSPFGGGGGRHDRAGRAGACGGGHGRIVTTTGTIAQGSLGGDGTNGFDGEAGAGGGAAGDAVASTGSGVRSVPGPGVLSIFGDTVCEGGTTKLRSEQSDGDDATSAGSGGGGPGSAADSPSTFPGSGGDGRVVVKVAKTYETPEITIDAAPGEGWGYTLNEAMTEATVPVSGTVVSGPSGNVEVRAIENTTVAGQVAVSASSWQEVTVTGGSFSGTITVPVNSSRLELEARIVGTTETFRQSGYWFTTLGIVMYGQSNTTLAFATNSVSETPSIPVPDSIDEYTVWAAYENVTVERDPANAVGNAIKEYTEELFSHTNVPMTLIWGGFPAVGTSGLIEGTAPFTKLESAIGPSNADLSTVHAIEVHQGENDVADDFATWADDWENIRSSIADITGQTNTNILMQISAIGVGASGNATLWPQMRYNQQEIANQSHTNTTFGTHSYQYNRADSAHYYGTSYGERYRIQARLMAWKLGFATDPGRFYISAIAKTSNTQTTVTLTHALGSDFTIETRQNVTGTSAYEDPTVTADIDCFEVSTDGTTWTTIAGADVTRVNGTTITLDHADLGTGTRYIRYIAGLDNIGVIVDNSGYNWPLEVTDPAGVLAA